MRRIGKTIQGYFEWRKAMQSMPRQIEISANKPIFKVDPKDPNFDKPLKELFKDYENNT